MTTEVSVMSSCLALPREGHLRQLFHIFEYLNKHHNTEMVFDPSFPEINEADFPRRDWKGTPYNKGEGKGLKEELPPNRPNEHGIGFVIRMYVDSDHAGDKVTRRSRTGFLVYCNSALIYWHSKKQTGIETSSFGSEFMAMKQGAEHVRGLRCELRMMGIPVDQPTYIYADNKSVLVNSSDPESVLKKKSNSVAYNFVREGCARDEWRLTCINTHENPADLMTKCLAAGEKRVKFVCSLSHHIHLVHAKAVGKVKWQS